MTNPPLDAGLLLRQLYDAEVDHVVIGGLAVIAHGVQRFTNDLDICPSPEPANLARLANLLKRLEARQLGIGEFDEGEFPFDPTNPDELAEGGNFRLLTTSGVIDLMQWIPGIADDRAYAVLAPDAVEGIAFGIPLKVCSLEHLRAMKQTADRPQDRQDLADLAAAHPERRGEGKTDL